MNSKISVLLVDDQQLVREGLSMLLGLVPDITVIGEACNGQEAFEKAELLKPDVILMDIQMPVMDGVASTKKILENCSDTKVIILTTFDDDEYIFEGLRAGASGYLLKDVASEQLAEAIHAAARGEVFIHPSVTKKVVNELTRLSKRDAVRQKQPLAEALSQRELEVLSHLAKGARNQEIAEKLFIAPGTVKNHVSSILSKFDARDRTEVIIKARELGYL